MLVTWHCLALSKGLGASRRTVERPGKSNLLMVWRASYNWGGHFLISWSIAQDESWKSMQKAWRNQFQFELLFSTGSNIQLAFTTGKALSLLHRCVGVSRNDMNEIATRIVIARVLNSLIYERRFCLDTFSNSLETCLKELWTHWLPWSYQAPAPHPRRVEGVAWYRHFFFQPLFLVRTDFGNPL